jgi:integrase
MQGREKARGKKGQVSIRNCAGRLQVYFPRELFGGQRRFLALGLSDSSEGYREAERRLKAIQADIDLDQFDVTLEKYQRQCRKQAHLNVVKEMHPDISLKQLWQKYVDYKLSMWKPTTYKYITEVITAWVLKASMNSPYKALELRQYLLENTTESMTKRVLTHVSAAFIWGIKHKLVKAPNPYTDMAKELKHNWEKESIPNAFTETEIQQVLDAFKNHKGKGISYSYYYSFVRFLFLSGCRPGEAVGLQWKDIASDYSRVTFNGGIYRGLNNKLVRTEGSKNNKKRTFPCNIELQQFLIEIKPERCNPESLIFPGKSGKPIRYNNFARRAWNKVVDPIKPDTSPYNCRDTFISKQIALGVSPAVVAKWCDNSTDMIEKHYLDGDAIAHILPQ